MIRRPPRYTRTDTVFPYTTLFRSWADVRHLAVGIGRDREMMGDNYSTIAGYVMWYLGRLPELGDRLERDNLAFTVTRMEGRRIAELEIKDRSEEHTSELQSLMRISYAVFCLKKKQIIIVKLV